MDGSPSLAHGGMVIMTIPLPDIHVAGAAAPFPPAARRGILGETATITVPVASADGVTTCGFRLERPP